MIRQREKIEEEPEEVEEEESEEEEEEDEEEDEEEEEEEEEASNDDDDSIKLSPIEYENIKKLEAKMREEAEAEEAKRRRQRDLDAETLRKKRCEQEELERIARAHQAKVEQIKSAAEMYRLAGPKVRAKMITIWSKSRCAPDIDSMEGITYWVAKLYYHAYRLREDRLDSVDPMYPRQLDARRREFVQVMIVGRREQISKRRLEMEQSRLRKEAEVKRKEAEVKRRLDLDQEMENNIREYTEKERRRANILCCNCGLPRKPGLWGDFVHRKCVFRW